MPKYCNISGNNMNFSLTANNRVYTKQVNTLESKIIPVYKPGENTKGSVYF